MSSLINLDVQTNLDTQNYNFWKNRIIQAVSIVAFAALGIGGALFAASYGTMYMMGAFFLSYNLFEMADSAFLGQFREQAIRACKDWTLYRRIMDKIEGGQPDVLLAQIAVRRDKLARTTEHITTSQTAVATAQAAADAARLAADQATDPAEVEAQKTERSKQLAIRNLHLHKIQKKNDFNLLTNKVRLGYLLWLDTHRGAPREFNTFITGETPRTLRPLLMHRHATGGDDVYLKRCDNRTFTRAELMGYSVEQIRDLVFNTAA
ncbi:MAG: hypothetical protein SP1CHLAM54_04410 [Chlamydiia bacterium]|nr:hypothetical protein [Chlamydiia bacterium]MCH9615355.1 hypothetical protein [Chlamydiia bacterium]MCH9628323.1 hypothetical protein [Chlamydiia bacterium]